MLKKNKINKFYKFTLMLFIILGFVVGVNYITAQNHVVIDPGMDTNIINGNITKVVGNAWSTISMLVMVLATGCIVITGLRYMLVSSDKKADIKQSSAYIIIGCALVFVTMPIINIVTNMFEETLEVAVIYNSPADTYKGNKTIERVTVTAKAVGKGAFENSSNLRQVTFEEGVTEIRDGAFKNCQNLEEIILPSTIRSIGKSAFEGCTNAKRIVIRDKKEESGEKDIDGVFYYIPGVEIGANAFKGCKGVETFTVGNHIYFSSIGQGAFQNCVKLNGFYNGSKELATLTFSGTLNTLNRSDVVSTIGLNAFENTNISELKLKAVNTDSQQFDANGERIKGQTHLTIGQIMTNKKVIKSIEIDKQSKVTFGEKSFVGFNELKTITIGAACDVTFGTNSFSNCANISSINISRNNKNITFGESSFFQSGNEMAIRVNTSPDSTIKFQTSSFSESGLKTAEFGSNINIEIGQSAFEGAKALTDFKSTGDNTKITKIGSRAFYGCTSFTSIENIKLNNIGESAFEGSGISGTVSIYGTSIGKKAFYKTNVQTVNLNAGEKEVTIGVSAFEGSSISALNPSAGMVFGIESKAFSGCTSLKELAIIFNSIGESAFESCSGLKNATLKANANNKVMICNKAFKSAFDSEGSLELGGNIDIGNKAFESANLKTLTFNGTGVSSIGEAAFYNCRTLDGVTITATDKDSRLSIGSSAFENAFNSKGSLSLKGNIIIGAQAFKSARMKTVSATNLTSSIGKEAFSDSIDLIEVTLTDPDIDAIGDNAFFNCINLVNFNIESTPGYSTNARISTIGKNAFRNVRTDGTLEAFNFGKVRCEKVSVDAFRSRKIGTLELIAIGDNTVIDTNAFCLAEIDNLSITTGKKITVNSKAFDSATIGTVKLAASNVCINENAFWSAKSLNNAGDIQLGGTITLKERAFNSADITNIIVANNTIFNTIPSQAFLNCGFTGFVNADYVDTYIKCNEIKPRAFEGAINMYALYISSQNNTDTIYIGNASDGDMEQDTAIVVENNNLFGDLKGQNHLLSTVKFKGNVIVGIGAFCDMGSIKELAFESNGSSNKIDIYNKAFNGCIKLKEVSLPVPTDKNVVFFNTIGLKAFNKTSINKIPLYLGENASIGRFAFNDDTKLEQVTLTAVNNAKGITIKEGAFAGGTNLNKLVFAKNGENSDDSKNPTFVLRNNSNERANGVISTNKDLTIEINENTYVDFGKGSIWGNNTNKLKVWEYGGATYISITENSPSFIYWNNLEYIDNP